MKKILSGFMVLLVVVCFSGMPFAAQPTGGKSKPSQEKQTLTTESSSTIMGKIVSINKTKNEIVVKDDETKMDKVIEVSSKDIIKLKKGELVKVVLEPGSIDKAGAIVVIKPEKDKKKEEKKGS